MVVERRSQNILETEGRGQVMRDRTRAGPPSLQRTQEKLQVAAAARGRRAA